VPVRRVREELVPRVVRLDATPRRDALPLGHPNVLRLRNVGVQLIEIQRAPP
jgi:hypothetical protein